MPQTNHTQVIVDPMVNVNYAGFFILGLFEKFGQKNVLFSNKPFKTLQNRITTLNFVIGDKKYCIDFGETSDVKPTEYDWCNVYGHVNANFDNTPEKYRAKLVSLAPYFGVKLLSHGDSALYAWKNMWKTWLKIWPFTFVQRYRQQCRYRVYYEEYDRKHQVDKNYVFHMSSVWLNADWDRNDEKFNEANARFISACQSISGLTFDGGLSMSSKEHCSPSLRNFACEGSFSVKEYLEKTGKSLVVFNAPFSNHAHGWKLSEYLALGKAIISLSLINDLPEPLVHGENVHFVEDNEASIQEAIQKIISDDSYREKLEKGARAYWEKYGAPVKALGLMGI